LNSPTHGVCATALLVCVFGSHCLVCDTRACAKDADTVAVQLPGGKHTITFRRLPKIADATPLASLKGDAISGNADAKPYELPSVYIAEKELSLFELRALVSEKTWAAYTARVLAYTGTDEDPKFGSYRKAVREGSEKFPAILVDLGTILEACIALDKLASEHPDALSLQSDLTTVGFRIPSRIEWQYAARGTQAVAEAQAREVFPKWPQFDTELKGRWLDLCAKAGVDPGRTPTPAVVCEAADSMLANKQSKEGYEFLGDVLRKALGFEVNIFRTADQRILSVDQQVIDAWGFHRLLGNVSEWTISAASLSDVESLWTTLKQADVAALSKDTRPLGVIMGGQFLNTVPQPRSWTKFSIAAGQSNDGAAFTVRDAFGRTTDGEVNDDFVNLKAGVRLCVRRSVSPQWFVAYRRGIRKSEDLAKANQDYRESFQDLCIAAEFDRLVKVLDAYQRAPEVAEASDDASEVSSFTDSMIAAALAFDNAAAGPRQGESAADEAIRRLRAAGLSGSTTGDAPQAPAGGSSASQTSPKRPRGPAPKPNYFDVLGSVNRS
jgi:hypothetical protein